MREIKYRTWDKETNRWADHNQQLSEVPVSASVNPPSVLTIGDDRYALMQFTGLHDRNGKEIYEGDIVTIGDYPVYEVIINDFSKVYCIDNDLGQEELYKHHKNCKVIGNIYEI